MRRRVLTVGVILLLIAAYLLLSPDMVETLARTFGATRITKSDEMLVAPTLLSVTPSNYSYISHMFSMQKFTEQSFTGTISVGGDQSIDFYVMNQGNFTQWLGGQPASISVSALSAKNYTFTLKPDRPDTYYFVFDNTYSNDRKNVVFSLLLEEQAQEVDPTVNYLVLLLLVVAVILVAYGTKGPRRKT
ncbi:MAG: hypothetical protein ACETVV_01115 [Nitrososphaeria archaeon]